MYTLPLLLDIPLLSLNSYSTRHCLPEARCLDLTATFLSRVISALHFLRLVHTVNVACHRQSFLWRSLWLNLTLFFLSTPPSLSFVGHLSTIYQPFVAVCKTIMGIASVAVSFAKIKKLAGFISRFIL